MYCIIVCTSIVKRHDFVSGSKLGNIFGSQVKYYRYVFESTKLSIVLSLS